MVHCLGTDGRTGGMEYGVIKLVNATPRDRVQFAVCSTRPADPALARLIDADVPYFECAGHPGNDPRVVLRAFRELARLYPRIRAVNPRG